MSWRSSPSVFFLTAFDFTVVNIAFRPIERDFGPASATLLPWTLSGAMIVPSATACVVRRDRHRRAVRSEPAATPEDARPGT